MTKRNNKTISEAAIVSWAALLALSIIAPITSAMAQTASLSAMSGLNIDPATITVSGISSGASMSVQFHVAHSAHVQGAGVIAGAPYACSEGSNAWSWMDLTGLYIATFICSSTNLLSLFHGPPDAGFSIDTTRSAAQEGAIDDPANLANDRIWLFSDDQDDLVPTAVMEVVSTYYEAFAEETNIAFEQHGQANHAMITEDFGNACDALEPPFINDCDFDAAGRLLVHLYGELNPRAPAGDLTPVIAFDQTAFFDQSDPSVSMNETGYLYVPASCSEGASCRLHVAFHGCQQSEQQVGDAFFAHAGYNRWAETNNIVVLYPQTTSWEEGFSAADENPNGCWDWWGYSGNGYYRKSGKQIRAIAALINALLGQDVLDTPAE